jgi:hypothetical protein
MWLFLIYNDPEQKDLCAWYKFSFLKDIIAFTNKLFRYSDVIEKDRIYRTYKTHFKVLQLTKTEINKFFLRKINSIE